MFFGPPRISGTPSTSTDSASTRMNAFPIAGRSIGSVTDRKMRAGLAPALLAASSSCEFDEASEARTIRYVTGVATAAPKKIIPVSEYRSQAGRPRFLWTRSVR